MKFDKKGIITFEQILSDGQNDKNEMDWKYFKFKLGD